MCEEGAYTEGELYVYERYLDSVRVENYYVESIKKSEQIGIEKGIEEGIEKGEKIGIEKGRKEEKENMVIKSFQNGASLDFISSISDLSETEVTSILQKYKLIK
jgi:flagellar biosynthesis/type III secretory pathway protein FliH